MNFIGIIVLGLAAWAAYAGLFYQTGPQWFEACWEKRNASREASTRNPSDAKQAVAWAQCEPMALAATYSLGVDFVSQYNDTIISLSDGDKLLPACPWAGDVPVGGWYMMVVSLIESRGGPSLIESFMPANFMLENLISDKWPNCKAARERLGYGVTSEGITYRIRGVDQTGEGDIPADIEAILDKYDRLEAILDEADSDESAGTGTPDDVQ